MTRLWTHAARLARAACVLWGIAGCSTSAADDANGAPTVAFVATPGHDGAALGSVIVHPLAPSALASMAASNPSVEEWQRVLAIRVAAEGGDSADVLPVLGSYGVAADTLRFTPRFPPSAGVEYIARFDGAALYSRLSRPAPPALRDVVTATWTRDVVSGPPTTTVRAVYPTADVLPMNLLRMYVEFSAPMRTGHSYDHVKVYAEGDSLLDEPFFTAGGAVELWDPERTRLTILFDPGRIKRDLKPHEERGLPLQSGRRYRLVVDSAWHDAEGRPLVRSYTKTFRVGPQDRSLVRPTAWRLTPPRAGTRDSVVLVFPEPLDHALLMRLLVVRDARGRSVVGVAATSEHETQWAFVPRTPWASGAYTVEVNTELEDLAGNNVRRLFDVAPGDSAALGVDASVVSVPFRTR